MRRSLQELVERADAFADDFEIYSPKHIDTQVRMPPIEAVELAAWRRDAAERDLAEAISLARAHRISWRLIGEVIGTTGEAARQRYAARVSQFPVPEILDEGEKNDVEGQTALEAAAESPDIKLDAAPADTAAADGFDDSIVVIDALSLPTSAAAKQPETAARPPIPRHADTQPRGFSLRLPWRTRTR
ncbi:MAG: hypothetical protein LBU38_07595 [Propionibacteriaceae bacterium]|jgi:hypothetical protein|nr:hypothetical protein [Propionibacteriaceae bacterium]